MLKFFVRGQADPYERQATGKSDPPSSATRTRPASTRITGNGNLLLRLFEVGRIQPYLTGGIGSFTADTVVGDRFSGTTRFSEHRHRDYFATNLGAGVGYRFNDWAGIGADYRTFFVHRDGTTRV